MTLASFGLYSSLLAHHGSCYGLLVAQIWRTGVDPSAISIWTRWGCLVQFWYTIWVAPRVLNSQGPMLPEFLVPRVQGFQGPMFPGSFVPPVQHSHIPMLSWFIVLIPKSFITKVLFFSLWTYIPEVLCSQGHNYQGPVSQSALFPCSIFCQYQITFIFVSDPGNIGPFVIFLFPVAFAPRVLCSLDPISKGLTFPWFPWAEQGSRSSRSMVN